MPKFFAYNGQINGDIIVIEGTDANHIANVLRSKTGDEIVVCDGSCTDYYCTLEEVSGRRVTAKINSASASASEPKTDITLYQGLPKGDKMELIIQKCVEIGVNRIVPVKTEFSVVKLDGKEEKKVKRWQSIAEAAAKQCGRGRIPKIEMPVGFSRAVEESRKCDGRIMPYENETEKGIKSFVRSFDGRSIAVFIGPEGGFSQGEAALAADDGIISITLGKRILRTETAGLVTAAILLYELEEQK